MEQNIWIQGSPQGRSSMNAAVNLSDGNVVAGNDLAKPNRCLLMFSVRLCRERHTRSFACTPGSYFCFLHASTEMFSHGGKPPFSRRQLELNHSLWPVSADSKPSTDLSAEEKVFNRNICHTQWHSGGGGVGGGGSGGGGGGVSTMASACQMLSASLLFPLRPDLIFSVPPRPS